MNYLIKISSLRKEQRAYADSYTEYIIEAEGFSEDDIKKFCTEILSHCNHTYEDSEREWYESYYSFDKIDKNKYKYVITSPYLD